jgi:hypothetical protein
MLAKTRNNAEFLRTIVPEENGWIWKEELLKS